MFDPNKYKQIAQKEFGPNAFNFNTSGVGLQAEAERLRKQLEGIISDRQRQLTSPKKSYQDAVNYISQNKDQFLNPNLNGGKSGAYQIANEIRNDPAKQAQIKAQGYNVSDYINALYAGLSDGNFRSEREYNQHVSQQKKDLKANPYVSSELRPQKQNKQQKKSSSHNLFGDLLNRVERNTANVINSAGLGIPNWLAEHAPKALQNVGLPIAPGINVSPKTMLNAQKPSTTTSGKVMDTLSNLAGYAVPGELAVKGAKLLKAGKGAEKGLQALGAGSKVANVGKLGAEGATSGLLFGTGQQGVDAALHPNDATLKQRLTNIGIDTGLGLVGDPLLHGVFKGLSKLKKPSEPSIHEVATTLKTEPTVKTPNQSSKQFENISPEEPKIVKLTKSEQQRMKNQDTFAANNADPTIPNTADHVMSKKDVKPSPSGLMDKAKIKLVDNLKPLDWFDKTVEKVTGKKLSPSESSYALGLNSRGSDMVSKQILTKNMVDSKGNVVGSSLKDVTKELDPKTLKAFEDYLVNKHAITRMGRGEKVFPDEMKMSPQKSEQIVKAYDEKYPKFKDLSKSYYEYNKQLGKSWLVDTGILSEKEWEGYLKANPNYVPNNRIFQDIERHMNQSAKRVYANQTNPIKKAVGSQRKIVSPIESTIEHTAQYVKTAKRNEVMQTLIKNIQKDPEAFKGWAEIVKTDKMPGSVKETLDKEGIDGVLENINKGFDQKPDLTKGNIVTGIIDGKKVHVQVHDPQLLEALTNLNPQQQNIVVNFFGQITRVMKNLTTGINPVFSLTRNVFRDIPQAYTNSKSTNNPIKFAKDLVRAFLDVVGNREAYQSFKNFGGGHASPISSDVNLLAQSKRSILPPKPGVIGKTKHVGGKLLGGLENLNNAIEAAPRLAEFKRIAKNGSYDSKIKGLYEANDVTTNFNKYGDATKSLDAFIPYLNAAVQGLDKLGRQFKDMPIQTSVKAAGAVTLPSIILYAINHDNPNYQQLSNYIKDQNFLIPVGDTFIKIPKPRELGVLFGSDVERTLRAWADNDPKAFDGFAQYVKEMFAPPTRPITAPLTDIRANKNFMGTPIVPGDLQNLSPKYQYDANTSEVAKGLGSLLNKSPKQIDYLMQSYGGVLGQLGIPATTKNTTVGQTLKKQVTADPVFSNDILTNFYDMKTKLDTAHNDYTKQGVTSPNLNEGLRKVFDAKAKNISDLRKQLKKALNNDSLTRKQREQQVRQLQQQINEIAKQTNQLVR